MNSLSLEALLDLYEQAGITCDINDGEIVRMTITGGDDYE